MFKNLLRITATALLCGWFVLACGSFVIACGSGSGGSGSGGSGTGGSGSGGSGSGGSGSGGSGSGGSGTGGSGTGGSGSGGAGSGGSGSGGSGVGSTGQGSGAGAKDYLTSATYSSLVVEVDYVVGQAPDSAALNLLVTRLTERCTKPGGVTLNLDDAIPDPGVTSWSVSDIQRVEAAHRDQVSTGTTAVLYVLYLNGQSDQDAGASRVLGLSYSASSFCLFRQSIRDVATLPITEPAIERAVLVHEAGHNLGLVNNGTPMVNNHQGSGAHDSNSNCVMHHTVETNLVSAITGTIPDQFDAECITDIQANGGK